MATAEITSAQPVNGLSYADAATKDAPNGDAPVIDLTNGANGVNGDKPHANGERTPELPTPGEYVGQGLDEAPRSPVKGHKKVSSRGSRGQLRPSPKEQKKVETEDKVVYESWNGNGKLTSVRPSADYEEALRLDEMEKSRNAAGELVLKSGRIPSAGWDRSGIRFAPLQVPLKRRLQTAMVLAHTLMAFILVSNFFFLAAIPIFWPILFPYMIYILLSQSSTDGTLRERSQWFRKQKIWSLFASYFPARLHRTVELTPTRKYIFGYHPHGIISHGAFAAFATEALGFDQLFPGITNSLLTLDSNFRIPFYRDYILRLGLCSVSKESCTNILTKGGPNNEGMGRAITIVVGGARESLGTKPGTLRLVLNCRKGFVKLAVETGADLVPVLCFGENDIYDQLDPAEHPTLHKFQLMMKKIFGFTTPVFHARGVFNYDVGIMPYRRPMNIVVGRPIKVQQQSTPDFDYVNKIHSQYVKELQLIWDTWKDDFARERIAELQIVE
jgi:2-acylglycerol O-acyltransferase 2